MATDNSQSATNIFITGFKKIRPRFLIQIFGVEFIRTENPKIGISLSPFVPVCISTQVVILAKNRYFEKNEAAGCTPEVFTKVPISIVERKLLNASNWEGWNAGRLSQYA